MSLMDRFYQPIAKRAAREMLVDLGKLQKANSSSLIIPASKPGILRYTFDPVYINSNYYNKKKPDSIISFDVLRNFSLKYEIARSCINLRKRQLTGMEYDVVTAETSDTNDYSADIETCREFIANLCGTINDDGSIDRGSYRKFISLCIEDIMALDALCLFKVFNAAGELISLVPVDAATIRLMIASGGMTPPPPEIAYKQVIRGIVTGEYTADEMIYTMMNPRTNSPYGLAPLESLMITVSSALKSGLYNLGYLTDGNIPEGLVEAPPEWTPTQIREFEANWNAAIAGDPGGMAKLRWLPADSKYVPTKKPEDMAFGQMNEWLMRVTCSVFDVMPVDIGFPDKNKGLGDKGANQAQKEMSNDKGLLPIANLLEEVFNYVIQEALGFPHLAFSFTGLNAVDMGAKADQNQKMIFSGQRTINEVRTDDGLDPIQGGDALFIVGQAMPLNQEAADIFAIAGKSDPEQNVETFTDDFADTESETAVARSEAARRKESKGKPTKPDTAGTDDADAADNDPNIQASRKSDSDFIKLVTELRTLRKYARNTFERGKVMRPFESAVLPPDALKEINFRLAKAKSFEDADEVIREYRQDYQIEFLANVNKLRTAVSGIIGNEQSKKTATATR